MHMQADTMAIDLARALGAAYVHDRHICLRELAVPDDIALLHQWFTLPYATYWNMQDLSEAQTREFYAGMMSSGHSKAYMGLFDGRCAFVVECYDPAFDQVADHYEVRPGDLGMHFFVGPPSVRIPNFTRHVFRSIMGFMFERLHATRIVVEPDVRNEKIHVLNRDMGFIYEKNIRLTQKLAALAFCTRENFMLAIRKEHTQ